MYLPNPICSQQFCSRKITGCKPYIETASPTTRTDPMPRGTEMNGLAVDYVMDSEFGSDD
jgi:hypothetical protein